MNKDYEKNEDDAKMKQCLASYIQWASSLEKEDKKR